MTEMYQKAIDYGLKRGADQIELFVLEGCTDAVQLEKNAICASESKTVTGIGIRAYSKKGLGIATTTLLEEESIKESIGKAVALSKNSPPDELFTSLPGPFEKYPEVKGTCDVGVCDLPNETIPEMAIQAIDAALEKHDVIISGNFKRSFFTESIYNSLGLEVEQKFSSLSGVIFAKAERNGDIATSWDYQKVRNKSEFEPLRIGRVAAENAVGLLGSKKVKSEELPVILDERSTMDTLTSIISGGLNAYKVLLGTAYFKDRLGDQITSEKITLIDNPLHPCGVGSASFDDEGVPHQKLTLIEEGVAKAFFSNSYCSNVLNIDNTGHASKGGLGSKPHPGVTQIQISPGDWSKEEIITETKKGLLLKDSSLEPSSNSPNISVLVDQGFLIENGEIVHPVKETMVGTNIFKLLKNIDAISQELLNESGSISPMVRISKAKIAGGK